MAEITKGGGDLNILGNAGSLYMVILILLLIIGLGSIGLWMVDYLLGFVVKSNKNIKNSSMKVK
ncbi:MAG: hypothetical protein K0R31_605 [Clostridiales bacterium]|jgi:hypothetical protein|nr:hypothetical protein [Clostridiales bacterium]